jgi:undecaprenyl-diphosphatase
LREDASISVIKALILGFVQGVTEFLPISSSGHLVILQNLFGMAEPQVFFDVMLHVGTLAAIFVVFRKEIGELVRDSLGTVFGRRPSGQSGGHMLTSIVVGCIPTALIGIVFSKQFERMFASMTAAGFGLLLTGVILMGTEWKGMRPADSESCGSDRIRLAHALLIGTAQGLAIFPGISRSGTTIVVALLLGVERELAARFSFLLAIPAILGALALELKGTMSAAHAVSETAGMTATLFGTAIAAIIGIIALRILLRVVRGGRISLFAYYCWLVGFVAIVFGLVRG